MVNLHSKFISCRDVASISHVAGELPVWNGCVCISYILADLSVFFLLQTILTTLGK